MLAIMCEEVGLMSPMVAASAARAGDRAALAVKAVRHHWSDCLLVSSLSI